ncbi:MAG: hypothetical protein E6G56_04135 [Actinobacteria bacterium]|nr:MAG: hypothetical protein E6G56_04135 [Actinomycetota bacterium]
MLRRISPLRDTDVDPGLARRTYWAEAIVTMVVIGLLGIIACAVVAGLTGHSGWLTAIVGVLAVCAVGARLMAQGLEEMDRQTPSTDHIRRVHDSSASASDATPTTSSNTT